MNNTRLLCALLLASSVATQLTAAIDFGSEGSTLSATAGTLALGTSTITRGTIADRGGAVTSDGTSGATFSDATYLVKDGTTTKAFTADASAVKIGTSFTLGNNQMLNVAGGQVAETVTITGVDATPSIIAGYGSFAAGLTLGAAADSTDYEAVMRWDGPLNQSITLSASATAGTAKVTLGKDLEFVPGKLIVASANGTNTVAFGGNTLSMGGVTLADAQTWDTARLNMIGNVTIAASKTVTLAIAAAYINGNGNKVVFNSGSAIANGGNAVTIADAYLSDVTSASLSGAGDWTFVNTVLDSGTEAIRIVNGSITTDGPDVFGGAAAFGASTIELLTPIALGGDWTLGGALTLLGNGQTLDVGGGNIADGGNAVTASDVTFKSAGTLGGSGAWTLSDVTVEDGTSSVTVVTGSFTGGGDILGGSATFGASEIQLNTDLAMGGTWTFSDDATIVGNGCTFDLTGGAIDFGTNTLTLRDMTLVVDAAAFADHAGTIALSNVTVIASSADIDLSALTYEIQVNGPCTIVVGSHDFAAPVGGTASSINGVTLWVDDLGLGGTVTGFDVSGGRQANVYTTSGDIAVTADASLSENLYLYVDDTGKTGRTLDITGSSETITYTGYSRSLVFPVEDGNSGTHALSVNGDNTIALFENIIFDGYIPEEHLVLNDTGTDVYYGDGTTILLGANSTPGATMTFGSVTGTSENMVLDLRGYTLNVATAGLALQGSGGGSALRIKNGTIANLSASKLAAEAGTTIILENVDLILHSSTDTDWANAALTFEGICSMRTAYGASSAFANTSEADLTIAAGARLTLHDGVTYSHDVTTAGDSFVINAAGVLEMIGATFSHTDTSAALSITDGTIIIDHKVTFVPGTNGMTIDAAADGSVDLVVRPGAQLIVNDADKTLYLEAA